MEFMLCLVQERHYLLLYLMSYRFLSWRCSGANYAKEAAEAEEEIVAEGAMEKLWRPVPIKGWLTP